MPSPEEIAASALAGMETRISAEDQEHQPQEPEEEQKAAAPPEASKKPPRKRRGPKPKLKFPVEPVVIQTVPRRKEYINHSYRDFSNVPPDDEDDNREQPIPIPDMTFSQKVHDILSHVDEFGACISWQPHGRAFQIRIPAEFEKQACPRYFGHKRYSSVLRQLNNHGFKHISKGVDRNCYYHEVCDVCVRERERESACVSLCHSPVSRFCFIVSVPIIFLGDCEQCFLRGLPHLCKYMPEPKDARRQIPDPANEPNFDAISQMYPLPPSNGAPALSAAVRVDPASQQQAAALINRSVASSATGASNTAAPSSTSMNMPTGTGAAAATNPLQQAIAAAIAGSAPNMFAAKPSPTPQQPSGPSLFAAAPDTASLHQQLQQQLQQQQQNNNTDPSSTLSEISRLQAQFAQQQPPAAPAPAAPPQDNIGMDRNSSLAEIHRLQEQLGITSHKTGMDRSSAIAEISSLQAQLGQSSSAAPQKTAIADINSLQAQLGQPSSSSGPQKTGMDRSSAVAEINRLRAHLASELSAPSSSASRTASTTEGGEPPAKRQAVVVASTPTAQLARIPQPFPRARGMSQVETLLQRDAIVSAIRRHQEQHQQQQQQQGVAVVARHINEELRTQQQIHDLQQLQQQQQQQQAQQQKQVAAVQELQTQQALQEMLRHQQQQQTSGGNLSRSSSQGTPNNQSSSKQQQQQCRVHGIVCSQ